MVQKYIVQLVDDLTMEPIEEGAGESVGFGLDGVSYAIDLSREHADELRASLERYVSAARKERAADGSSRAYTAKERSGKTDTKAVREWASRNGYTVSGRGRVPGEILAAYNAR